MPSAAAASPRLPPPRGGGASLRLRPPHRLPPPPLAQGYAFCEFVNVGATDSTIQALNGKPIGNKFLTGTLRRKGAASARGGATPLAAHHPLTLPCSQAGAVALGLLGPDISPPAPPPPLLQQGLPRHGLVDPTLHLHLRLSQVEAATPLSPLVSSFRCFPPLAAAPPAPPPPRPRRPRRRPPPWLDVFGGAATRARSGSAIPRL
jgi:hypothetical protein